MSAMKPVIQFDQFAVMDLRIGKVIECIEKEGSEKLLRLIVDFGEEGKKTIFTGIKQFYKPEELLDKSFLFIINLAPRKMMDEFSEGMLLAANGEKPMPLTPISDVSPGTTIR